VTQLSPTQSCVGLLHVSCIMNKLESYEGDKHGYERHLMKTPVPVTLAPTGELYLTDRHHHARAVQDANLPFHHPEKHRHVYVCVTGDLRATAPGAPFWAAMNASSSVWLSARGREIAPSALPASVEAMTNDAFFSLSRYVRDSRGYITVGIPQCAGDPPVPFFLEARWAQVLRGVTPLPGVDDMSAGTAQAERVASAIAAASKGAIAPIFADMPGFNQNPTEQPIELVSIDMDTFCDNTD
jgi:hypothetical protein